LACPISKNMQKWHWRGKSKTKKQEGLAELEWDGIAFFFKCPDLFILEEIDEETMD